MQKKILAVDDNVDSLYALGRMLEHAGYEVFTASSGSEALQIADQQLPDLILLDVMMPELDGLQVTKKLKIHEQLRFSPVILLTAKDTLQDVVQGLEAGADGYITKPFKPEELLARTKAALRLRDLYLELRDSEEKNARLVEQVSQKYNFESIIGSSNGLKQVFFLISKVSKSDSPVLITGASGTGKELVARALHFNSPRKTEAFLAKNCAAFSETLLESQLFGHVKGAFTGAVKDQKGLFEAAHRGTLFLDEIGEMPLHLQAKLLRVLQEGTFMPVGSTQERRVDVRILAATNRDLQSMARQGTFREDLYYRLNVISIPLPALKDRKEDIPLLIEHFLRAYAERKGEEVKEISPQAQKLLLEHEWRGNIRELENEIERLLILGSDEAVLDIELLSPHIALGAKVDVSTDSPQGNSKGGSLKAAIEDVERRMIAETLKRVDGNKSLAAKELGMSRSNLIQKVQLYGLEAPEIESGE